MKKPIAVLALLSTSLLFGQAYDSSSGGGGSPNFFGGGGGNGGSSGSGGSSGAENQNNVMNVGSGAGLFESQTSENMADRVFNVDSDSVNFEDGTYNWKGRTFNVGNNRVARARFERYLATPDLNTNDEIYLGILQRIAQLLSLVGEDNMKDTATLSDEVFQAWQMLFKAARYEMDQGISITVANQVYNVWRIRDENTSLTRARQLMDEEMEDAQGQLLSQSAQEEYEHEQRQRLKSEGRHTGQAYEGVTDTTFGAQKLVNIQTQMAAMETLKVANGQVAKLQFQSQIVNLLLTRRFEHCMIASQFYRFAFKGSHQTITVGGEELGAFLPVSDFTPTVETVELLAREAQADVRIGMKTVDSLYASNELFGALERLQETFFLGEYEPDVLQFPAEKKRKLLDLYRKTRELQVLIDHKDYEGIERVTAEAKELAYDFPASQVLSGVQSVQRMSNLSLMAARQAVGQGDFAKAETMLERATGLWPQNPAIRSYMSDMADKADVGTQASVMFDEMYNRKDYRAIYTESANFSGALINDSVRREKLKEAVDKIARVDFLIVGAQELDGQGNSYAAWEILADAEKIYADDYVLARAQAKLAPRVADFVGALDRAEQAEAKGQFALSLTRYLEAKEIYPTSKISHHGIEQMSEKVMDGIRPPAKAAPSDS
ncbi:hypothetical protein [Cerasicoccus arenae]|uniref:Uncharacterized protein n=1 Tax=Cerasicoccus arenae TaxID=424488 RepID=A0A8J3GFA8_9BACT|nr:hypothetical protein [Cerasicoccus arenae]MBK1858348.1 hypothetical protein [Cerasicoccus arenae]GHC09720.1 hypothetical protein GCM10007047_28770 [Cerasicoccus arenae]